MTSPFPLGHRKRTPAQTCRDVGSVPIVLQKSPSGLCEIEICNYRIGAPVLLNRCCAFQPDLESIFLAEMLKILLQHNLPISDICGVAEANAHAMLAYRSAGTLLPLNGRYGRRSNWEKYDEHTRGRRRNDGRDPPGGGMAATASGRDPVGHPMAALRRLRASGGDRRPVRCGLQHSRRSCVLHSHIGARNLLRLPVVHGATRPAEGRRHGSRRNRPGCFRPAGGELWLQRSVGRRGCGCSGDRPLCDQIEVHNQSDMTTRVKSGIAPANLAMTDWESFDVRFGSYSVNRPYRPSVWFARRRTWLDDL